MSHEVRRREQIATGAARPRGAPPPPQGAPLIESTLDVDASGIPGAPAQSKSFGKSNQISIPDEKGRLPQAEIDYRLDGTGVGFAKTVSAQTGSAPSMGSC